jgi:hypothetical protein
VLRHVVRLAAVTFAVAAAGFVAPVSPVQAATCGSSSGVTVVVDFHQLRGGGAQTACDSGGAGKYAAAQFTDAGHALTYVQNEAFVCQVDGLGSPQCSRTPPADAYWSLWWSDGKSGAWKYASLGVTALKVPSGGYVALSWQKGSAQAPPRVTLAAHAPPTSPTSSPTTHPTGKPSSHPTQGPTTNPTSGITSSAPVSPTGSPSRTGKAGQGHSGHTHGAKPSKSAKPHHHASKDSADQATGPVAGVSSAGGGGSGSGGLPGWVAPVAVVAIFVLGGAVTVLRRKSTGGP